MISALPPLGTTICGDSPPEVFVGRQGYPLVKAGPLLPACGTLPEVAGRDVGDYIAMRSRLVRSETSIGVHQAMRPSRLLETAQEIAMSSRPVSLEVSFVRPPAGNLSFDGVLSPSGPSGEMREVELTSSPSVPRRVDALVADTDISASQAAEELFLSRVDVDQISRLLSVGLLGKRRKLVPTRWSITASDDMVGRALKREVLNMPVLEEHLLFSGELLGNHFEILLMPRSFAFELIEIWLPHSAWMEEQAWIGADREGPGDRRGYSTLAGGYYAARLASLEILSRLGRQASVLALREINEQYWAPLGVWVVREAARKAASHPPSRLETLEEAISEMHMRMRTPADSWRRLSSLSRPAQATLSGFFL